MCPSPSPTPEAGPIRGEAPFPASGHDHHACREAALRRAEDLCAGRGARLTAIRRRVLDLLWADHHPVSAYDLLGRLNDEGWKAAPPAVYRALEFLIAQGLAHRLASLNAFVGCTHPERPHGAQFFICRACRTVAEVNDPAIAAELARAAGGLGFVIQAPVVEIEGLCPHCAAAPGHAAEQNGGGHDA